MSRLRDCLAHLLWFALVCAALVIGYQQGYDDAVRHSEPVALLPNSNRPDIGVSYAHPNHFIPDAR